MIDNPTIKEFIREAMPEAHDSRSSLETLARTNPSMLGDVIDFALMLGFRSALSAIAKHEHREDIEKALKENMRRGMTLMHSGWGQ